MLKIMENTLKIAELIGTDIRSRANAEIIRAVLDGVDGTWVLDFGGVTFMSRSFTDELCVLLEANPNITIANANEFVRTMIDIVASGRKQKRVRPKDNSVVKEFEDMESLSAFVSTIG